MPAGPTTAIGARLSLLNSSAFIDQMSKATASTNAFADAWERAAAASSTAADKMSLAADKTAVAGGASADAALATDAALAKSNKTVDDATTKTKQLTAAHKDLAGTLNTLASNAVVKGIAKWGTISGAAGLYESIKTYTEANKAITQSFSQANLAVSRQGALTAGVLNISAQTGQNLNDVAAALYRVASAEGGVKKTNTQLLSLVDTVEKLNVLGNVPSGFDSENTARIVTSMYNAQLKGATKISQIAPLINATVGTGDLRMSQLLGALGRGVLVSSKAEGLSAPSLMAWIDLMTHFGAQPNTAGTLISHASLMLASGSEQEQHVYQMLGIQPGTIQAMVSNPKEGINGTLQYIRQQLKKFNPVSYYPSFDSLPEGAESAMGQLQAWGILSPTQIAQWQAGTLSKQQQSQIIDNGLLAKAWGGARQELPLLMAFLNPQRYSQIQSQIERSSTQKNFNRDYAIANATPAQQLKIAEARMKVMAYDIGKIATGPFVDAMHALSDVAEIFVAHPNVLKGFLAGLTSIVGLAVAVTTANKLAKLAQGTAALGKAITGIFTGGASSSIEKDSSSFVEKILGGGTTTATGTMNVKAGVVNVLGAGDEIPGTGGGTGGVVGKLLRSGGAGAGSLAAGGAGADVAGIGGSYATGATTALGESGLATGSTSLIAGLAGPLAIASLPFILPPILNKLMNGYTVSNLAEINNPYDRIWHQLTYAKRPTGQGSSISDQSLATMDPRTAAQLQKLLGFFYGTIKGDKQTTFTKNVLAYAEHAALIQPAINQIKNNNSYGLSNRGVQAQDLVSLQKDASDYSKAASKDEQAYLKDAADHNKTAAAKMLAAAEQHAAAAKELMAAATALENMKINATVSAAAVTAAVTKNLQTTTARA